MSRAFTPEQVEAIARREGPLLLSASAGSGKTSVLVERFVASVVADGLRPAQVLVITFTDKAAGELRARVRARLLELDQREAARDTEGAWVLTFHGFCARVLRAHAVGAGLDPAFAVLDEAAARAARRQAFDRALADFLADRDGTTRRDALDLVAAYGADRLEAMVRDAHDTLRSRGHTRPALPRPRVPDVAGGHRELAAAASAAATALAGARSLLTIDRARAALAACLHALDDLAPGAVAADAMLAAGAFKGGAVAELKGPECARYLDAHAAFARACRDVRAVAALALTDELLGRYADAYAQAKREVSAVDFDDLELHVRDLFDGTPAVAEGYATRFERIMVDEFQDTNPLQLALLDHLDRDNVFAVGDELQSIYGFRHADVELFRARRETLASRGAAATLATSFRAHPDIVATIDAAFAPVHGAGWIGLRAGRADAPASEPLVELLITDADACADEDGAGLPAASPARRTEARLVASRVAELVHAGLARAGDVAVLLRAATNMPLFEQALELEGLSTLSTGGRGWWARRQVQDLCAYLGALVNPRDEPALLGLLACPLVGLSSDALALIARAARGGSGALWDAVLDPELALGEVDAARLRAFQAWFGAERAQAPRRGIDELLARVVARTGYDLHVLALPGGERRLANVHKLQGLAAAFEARHGRDLRAFIDLAAAELEADAREPDAPVDLGDLDAVRLMTIHAAKGLEFGVVVLADLGRPPNVRQGDLLVDGDRVGLRLVEMDGATSPSLDHDALRGDRRAAEAAEERRVMHVALTRARERLIVSGALSLGSGWPTTGGAAEPPLAWMARALVPDVGELVTAGAETVHERATDGQRMARVRVAFRGGGEEQEQLTLALADRRVADEVADSTTAASPAGPREPGAAAATEFSYSSLGRYARCPYRFYLERELGLRAQEVPVHLRSDAHPVEGLDPLARGTLVHELLEGLDLSAGARPPSADDVRDLGAVHEVALDDAQVADLLAMVAAFAASDLRARLGATIGLAREQPFAFALDADGALVNGIVDVLGVEADGTALIVDYKSDPVAGADLDAVVEASYGVQRRMYALAALRSGAPATEIVHLFLERAGEPVTRRYAATDAERLADDLRARAAGLLAGEYPVTDTPHRGLCATCPGRGGLCSQPLQRTDRVLVALPEKPDRK